jgi:hypothetical protein
MIEFVCIAAHDRRDDPSITLEQKAWAYCAAGATEAHAWSRIDPTAVETLRLRPGNGRLHLVPDDGGERSLAPGPAR